MKVENDEGLGALIRSSSEEKLCGGFTFTEGPVWLPGDSTLLFSDIPNNRIYRWRPETQSAEVFREPSHHSNGLTLDHQGRLIACEHSARRVTRSPLDSGKIEVLAESYQGKRLNSPNDVVVHSSGAIYFTDPTYGLPDARETQDLDFQGVYRLDPDGRLSLLTADFTQPNGLAFSPDEAVLYVNDSEDLIVRRFEISGAGALRGGETLVDMRDDPRSGGPDGMKVDTEGRLWVTGAGGVWVVEPSGHRLGVLELPEYPANIAFGGPDYSSIFLTAWTSVYRVETSVRGIAPGSR